MLIFWTVDNIFDYYYINKLLLLWKLLLVSKKEMGNERIIYFKSDSI
jgi:hypothetical protein